MDRTPRRNYSFAPERIERLRETPEFQHIATSDKEPGKARDAQIRAGRRIQDEIILLLSDMNGKRIYRDRDEFRHYLESAFKGLMKIPPYFWDVMMEALSEPDDSPDSSPHVPG